MSVDNDGSGDQNLRPWFIYTLHDPREPSVIRYVGWATDTKRRFNKHLADARADRDQTYCGRWKRTLLELNVVPVLTIVESGLGDGWKLAESQWVNHLRSAGHKLTNLTDGGDGTRGYKIPLEKRRKLTDEQKRKIGDAHRGRKHTSESRSNMRLSHLGKKHTPEQTAKISQANRGRKQSEEERNKRRGKKMPPEAVAKSAASRRGQKRTPEFSRKMSLALKGRKLPTQQILNMEKSRQGMKLSIATREKISKSITDWHAKRREVSTT
jgi:hypothetical protein